MNPSQAKAIFAEAFHDKFGKRIHHATEAKQDREWEAGRGNGGNAPNQPGAPTAERLAVQRAQNEYMFATFGGKREWYGLE